MQGEPVRMQGGSISGRRELLLPLGVLMALAFALYANTFGNSWNFDDFPVIVENPDIRSLRAFFNDSYPGRPLREITYLLDHALFGLNPAGWHIQNIFWHGLNAGLLFLLALRLGGTRAVAWIASLLFLVHPLQVEVVANISHRKDSLSLAFSLLSMLAYIQALTAGHRKKAWLAAAFLAGVLAFLGKQIAVALPAVFLAYELGLLAPEQRLLARRPWLVFGGVAMAAFAGGLWYLSFGGESAHLKGMQGLLHLKANYAGEVTSGVYYLMILKSWSFTFLKLLMPLDLALEYTYPVPTSFFDIWVLSAVAGIAFYLLLLVWSYRCQPVIFFGLIWAVVFWLPVSNLWPFSYFAADRYMYSPSAGLFVAASTLIPLGLFRFSVAAILAASAILLALAGLTFNQNKVWHSPRSLWEHSVKINPQASFALNNLGWLYLREGDTAKAIEFFQRAAANPYNPHPLDNLGWIYEQLGDRPMALSYYRRYLQVAGNDPLHRDRIGRLKKHLVERYGVVP